MAKRHETRGNNSEKNPRRRSGVVVAVATCLAASPSSNSVRPFNVHAVFTHSIFNVASPLHNVFFFGRKTMLRSPTMERRRINKMKSNGWQAINHCHRKRTTAKSSFFVFCFFSLFHRRVNRWVCRLCCALCVEKRQWTVGLKWIETIDSHFGFCAPTTWTY